MLKILDIDPDSPLFGRVRPGYSVLSVNGRKVLDAIDFRFRTAEEQVRITFVDSKGRQLDYRFQNQQGSDLGVTLDDCEVRRCTCDCIFCFVRQQPKGMRRALYVKDEDYRLSFTHGNFVTLSNMTEKDLARIIDQRLSPLYVSVHATDDSLRRCMLRNERLAPIIPRLRQLADNGITIHAQAVICPGVNDGVQFEKTVNDLAALHPHVETLGIVPVGLTRYRDRLPRLRTHTPKEASDVIGYIERRQREFLAKMGTRFVWPADEFYVIADRPFPSRASYEEMSQFENGIGMAREFISMINRRKTGLRNLRSKRKVLALTGKSAYPFLQRDIMPFVTKKLNLNFALEAVPNEFWGPTVTVTGLLTGRDMLAFAKKRSRSFDAVVIPPNCLNGDELFLDDLSLAEFRHAINKPVFVGQYNLAATLKEVYS